MANLDLSKYCDKAICMTLDSRKELYEDVASQFGEYNLPISRFLMGNGKQDDTYSYIDDPEYNQTVNYNIAFKTALNKAYSDKCKNVLMLEDDVQLCESWELIKVWKFFLEQESKYNILRDYDMLYLGLGRDKSTVKVISNNILRLYFQGTGLFAVLISAKMIPRILELPVSSSIGIDGFISGIQARHLCYSIFPSIATFKSIPNRENKVALKEDLEISRYTIGDKIL